MKQEAFYVTKTHLLYLSYNHRSSVSLKITGRFLGGGADPFFTQRFYK